MIRVGVLTMSDKASRGEREDLSGKVIEEMVEGIEGKVEVYRILPDEQEEIERALIDMADEGELDLVLTTGGTGLAARDVTPEATRTVIQREVPGFGEIIRARSFEITPAGILSRMTAGIRGRTLVINLPGSPKAVRECLDWIMPSIPHAVELLRGEVGDHERP